MAANIEKYSYFVSKNKMIFYDSPLLILFFPPHQPLDFCRSIYTSTYLIGREICLGNQKLIEFVLFATLNMIK